MLIPLFTLDAMNHQATHGRFGWKIINNNRPDLII